MRLVLDTNVVVAGVRSRSGASNTLLVAGFQRRFVWCCSPALYYEYEDVLGRAELLLDFGVGRAQMAEFLIDIAGYIEPVELHYRWRPQLRDPADEMVLETAINAQADAIVTHNMRDFGDVPGRFGIDCIRPGEAMRRLTQ